MSDDAQLVDETEQPLWKPTTDRLLWFFLGLGLMYVVAVVVYFINQPPAGAIPL